MEASFCHSCGERFARNSRFCTNCGIPRRFCKDEDIEGSLDDAIRIYFSRGSKIQTIKTLLEQNLGVYMSLSTLKRHLRRLGLKRKPQNVIDDATKRIIEQEVRNTGGIKGYRSIWHKLKVQHGLFVTRDSVMNILREIDPIGSANRKARRLVRRVYHSSGPNAVWHADGYDKLKPYGFPIHGCIDGFSRKILWLQCCRSNNNPLVPAHYFLDTVNIYKGCPSLLRTDRGTENGIMASLQAYLHNDLTAHKYGSSHYNQRIENLWSHLRRNYISWMIDYFKEMVDASVYTPGNFFQTECLWFSFANVLQQELDKVKLEWNTHSIRKSRLARVWGKPNEMFEMPESYGYQQCGMDVNTEDLSSLTELRDFHGEALDILNEKDDDLDDYFHHICHIKHIEYPPNSWSEAREIYDNITLAASMNS